MMGLRDYLRRRRTESVELTEVEVSWLGIKGKWIADRRQQTAAWDMYVELITRISVQPLDAHDGLLREALNSLYALFGETRRILRQQGPEVARPLPGSEVTFAVLAVTILNQVLRPLLARWHPLLEAWEVSRPADRSPRDHEVAWPHYAALRGEIEAVRVKMLEYADLLAKVAGVRAVVAPTALPARPGSPEKA
jgi:hypothetical protein